MKGRRPTTAIEEAKACAERMGYCWCRNTDTAFPFDAFIFREMVISVVKVKKVRYAIDDKKPAEKFFPEEIEGLRNLKMPSLVMRELWVRTQDEREWRRFIILSNVVGELGFNEIEGYVNPHYDEAKWKTERNLIIYPLEVMKKWHDEKLALLESARSVPPNDNGREKGDDLGLTEKTP
jgi:hypothetical protein